MRCARLLAAALTALVAAGPDFVKVGSAQPVPMHLSTPAPYGETVGAHARYSKARINLGSPNLALTFAVVTAGGGAASFDSGKLITLLTGNGPVTQTELASLTKKFGADNVASFEKTFNYVITDSLAQEAQAGVALPTTPSPDPSDPKALSAALYAAGTSPHGGYDVEYMLDTLVSHVVHVAVMNDIDANPDLGPKADANYHAVLSQTILDLKNAYKLQ
jgi:hypothetical protein